MEEFRLTANQVRMLVYRRVLPFRQAPRTRRILWERAVVEAYFHEVPSLEDAQRRAIL
jgi:hypothetical protein